MSIMRSSKQIIFRTIKNQQNKLPINKTSSLYNIILRSSTTLTTSQFNTFTAKSSSLPSQQHICTPQCSHIHTSSLLRSGGAVQDPEMPDSIPEQLAGNQLIVAEMGDVPDFPSATPFGTMEHPAMILSGKNQRIVGCVGGHHVRHRLMWFSLKYGKPHVCAECGQVFKLVNDNNWDAARKWIHPELKEWYEAFSEARIKYEEDMKNPTHSQHHLYLAKLEKQKHANQPHDKHSHDKHNHSSNAHAKH